MLQVNNLCAGYGSQPVLKNITFGIEDGTIACVLGQNGSGKSTLLKSIAHIIPYQGQVIINGENIAHKKTKERAKYFSIMGGLKESFFPYTVTQTVLLARYAHTEKKLFSSPFSKQDYEIVNRLLEELQISHLSDKLISNLSSGQLQKVLLARALAQESPVLLLDEPTSHLDLKAQIEIAELLHSLKQKYRLSIVAVLHDLNLALQSADQIILLKDGAILENTTVDELKNESLNTAYETDVISHMQKGFVFWNRQREI